MKKIILILAVISVGFAVSAQTNNGWDKWQASSCYENISFRLKLERSNGGRHEWKIQFRNNYDRQVTFNYGITEDERNFLSTSRKTLGPKEVSDPQSIYTGQKDFFVLIDKLSFSLYQDEFIPCDNN